MKSKKAMNRKTAALYRQE